MAQADIQNFILDLRQLTVQAAKSSTKEYYYKWKDASYRLSLGSNLRGKALIFVTTTNRVGWQKDVKNFYVCCKSLNITTEIEYDPDANEVDHKLQEFVTSEENSHIDCCFVLFMGHGFGKEQNVYFKAKEEYFNIYAKCQFYFRKEISNLKKKPKVVLVQVCRTPVENLQLLCRATCDLTEYFRCLPKFTDYKFVFASQHGEFVWRSRENGCFFVRSLCHLLFENAHDTHLDNIIKMMLFNFENNKESDEVREQMPEEWSSMPRFLNLFPGITRTFLNTHARTELGKIKWFRPCSSQQFCSYKIANYRPIVRYKNAQRYANEAEPIMSSWKRARNNDVSETFEVYGNKSFNISATENQTNYNNLLCYESQTLPHNYEYQFRHEYKLNAEVLVEPDTDENQEDACNKVMALLSEKQSMLENYLTNELETPVVCKIAQNVIHIFTDDQDVHEILQFLSDTGLFSSMIASQLDLSKQHFIADQIMLKIKLNSRPEKYYPVYQHLPDKTVRENGNITITIPDTRGAFIGKCFKNEQAEMQSSETVHLEMNDEGIELMISKAKLSDSGLYECRHHTRGGREVVTKFSLSVVPTSHKCKFCSSCVIL